MIGPLVLQSDHRNLAEESGREAAMSNIVFDEEMGRIQRAIAESHDLVVRRNTFMETLNLRTGEKVLELGCGGGFYAFEAAQFVGPTGHVSAIDISANQIAAARERCARFAWVECQIGNLLDLPYRDGEFDAVYSVQVLEYAGDLRKAFREIRRVLRDGGRFLNISTNWSSCVWYSENKERMRRVLDGWSAHETHRDLPAILAGELRKAGLQLLHQRAIPIVNTSIGENSFSYWIAKLIPGYAVGQGAVNKEEADAWVAEFAELDQRGEYFFSLTPILTEAIRIA
jgi:ubiquinone/menaquinone biosynthesis C-methylase UbiE